MFRCRTTLSDSLGTHLPYKHSRVRNTFNCSPNCKISVNTINYQIKTKFPLNLTSSFFPQLNFPSQKNHFTRFCLSPKFKPSDFCKAKATKDDKSKVTKKSNLNTKDNPKAKPTTDGNKKPTKPKNDLPKKSPNNPCTKKNMASKSKVKPGKGKPGKTPKKSPTKKNINDLNLVKAKKNAKTMPSYIENTQIQEGNLVLDPLFPPSGKSVMVVESATKAKTIQKYLGDMFEVIPTYGHVRDLAGRSGSVRPDDDFSMVWEVPSSACVHIKTIKLALSGVKTLILATDPDREGEAIAWHLLEMLHQQDALENTRTNNITVARVIFHEITETSIKKSLESPRTLDLNLINAYLARRALDYLIGFSVSPLLWRKLPGCQSAGRVQSAALALICDRELEIDSFDQREYWTIEVEFGSSKTDGLIFTELSELDFEKLNQFSIVTSTNADCVADRVSGSEYSVVNLKRNKINRNPPLPFITSTLQQDSANKLHFAAAYTMKLAQKLYEGVNLSKEQTTGLITYMRTDGLHMSDSAVMDIHSFIRERYGQNYAVKEIRKYFKKVKNAQEAHEAIRPTSISRLPSSLVGILDEDSLKLYTLIWARTVACQMEAAVNDTVQVDIGSTEKDIVLHSSSSEVNFLGYQAVYKDPEAGVIKSNDSEEVSAKDKSFQVLTSLMVNDRLQLKKVECKQHHTKPPGRYSEGSLVKKLEELGIGRPSTYAPILKVLQERKYVTAKSRVLYPEFRGRMVSTFLSHYFSEVLDYSFTAYMEDELDNVSAGTTEWKGLLKDYWTRFKNYCDLAGNVNIRQLEKILEKKFEHVLFNKFDDKSSRICPSCSEGTLVFKITKHGTGYFIGCDQHPKCNYISSSVLNDDNSVVKLVKDNAFPPKLLGLNPETNEQIFLKRGPYGFYVQLGDDRKEIKECPPKRASLEVKDIESLTLEGAMELLSYPISLGNHPNDGSLVTLAHSKYGFTVRHQRTIVPVPKDMDPKTITIEDGLKLLLSDKARHGRTRKTTYKEKGTLL